TALTYVLFLSTTLHPPDLHSFPTRRSSDLEAADVPVTVRAAQDRVVGAAGLEVRPVVHREAGGVEVGGAVEPELDGEGMAGPHRSEEHTSELQSRFDLVCRLLLEKKKKTHK